MRIEDVMSHHVVTCSAEDSLEEAARRMWEHDVGCLVAVDREGRPTGVITDRDITMAAYTRGVRLREEKVGSAMARELVTCVPGTPLHEVEGLMRQHRVRRMPVVDSHGRLCGIFALGDLVRAVRTSHEPVSELRDFLATLGSVTSNEAKAPTESAA
jgi:CBS-domain-containing membrane protein